MPVDLKKITRGREKRPPKVLIYGQHGVGKTTFAAGIPGALFLDSDRGSHRLDVAARVVPESWKEFCEWLTAIERGEVKCDALVLDSLTQLEQFSHAEFFGQESLATWQGGYGKGDNYAIMRWREIVAQLERIWRAGKPVVIVGHCTIKTFNDPIGPSYDQYLISAQQSLAGLVAQWADYVLFAKPSKIELQKVDGENKAMGYGETRLYTRPSPGYWAKARGTTIFPENIGLSWMAFQAAIEADEQREAALRTEIGTMLKALSDDALVKKTNDFLASNPGALVETRNRLAEIQKEREGKK